MIGTQPYTVSVAHPNFLEIKQAIKVGDWEAIPNLVSMVEAVKKYIEAQLDGQDENSLLKLDVEAQAIKYNGIELHNVLVEKIFDMMGSGFNIKPMRLLLQNVMENSSNRAIEELYTFMQFAKMPITEDGHIIAYKRVCDNYTDVYTGQVLNKPAELLTDEEKAKMPYTTETQVTVQLEDGITTVTMPRNMVDDRSDHTCSRGLHFCSHDYLKNFTGERLIIIKINPRDVVSIPVDYNNTKGRACRYQVIGEIASEYREQIVDEFDILGDMVVYDEDGEVDDGDDDISLAKDVDSFDQSYDPYYYAGYKDGRNRDWAFGNTALVITSYTAFSDEQRQTAANVYNVGYKDGKGHKSRRV